MCDRTCKDNRITHDEIELYRHGVRFAGVLFDPNDDDDFMDAWETAAILLTTPDNRACPRY